MEKVNFLLPKLIFNMYIVYSTLCTQLKCKKKEKNLVTHISEIPTIKVILIQSKILSNCVGNIYKSGPGFFPCVAL